MFKILPFLKISTLLTASPAGHMLCLASLLIELGFVLCPQVAVFAPGSLLAPLKEGTLLMWPLDLFLDHI